MTGQLFSSPFAKDHRWQRVVWLLALLAIQWLYVPINRHVQGGTVFKTPLDDLIPLWPAWAVPYQLCMLWWVFSLFWFVIKVDYPHLKAFGSGTLAVILTSYIIYLAWPTYVERPILSGDRWDIQLMHWIYNNDRPYNAFPSSHTYITTLVSLSWQRLCPRLWWLWSGIVVIVILSTLFTRQHYLPDPLGGLALAFLGYGFGMRWATGRQEKSPA